MAAVAAALRVDVSSDVRRPRARARARARARLRIAGYAGEQFGRRQPRRCDASCRRPLGSSTERL